MNSSFKSLTLLLEEFRDTVIVLSEMKVSSEEQRTCDDIVSNYLSHKEILPFSFPLTTFHQYYIILRYTLYLRENPLPADEEQNRVEDFRKLLISSIK